MCYFLEEMSSVYYSKYHVKVRINGILETQELTVYLKHKSLELLSDEMAQCCIIKVIVGWIKQVSTGGAQS